MSFQIKTEKILSAENCKRIIAMGISLKDSVENISKELIEEYDSTKTYSPDMACYYNDYLYRCLFATTGEFDINSWKKVGDSLELVNKAQVEAMLGLTQEQLETLASIILDSEVRLDKTFSSSKIFSDMQDILSQSKKFTLEEFAKANKASYTVTDSVDTMTDQSTIYLLKNDTTYDMYIVQVDGTPTKIGDVNIDLSQYAKLSDLDNFVKKTDADGKYATITTVDGKVDKTSILSTISSTPSDDKLLSEKAINDTLVKKTDITTTIDSTSTDNTVPSAKCVYNEMLKFGSNPNVYTLGEQVVGQWIDGKTIYRKVINKTCNIMNGWYDTGITISDIDKLIRSSLVRVKDWCNINDALFKLDSSKILVLRDELGYSNFYFILEYTKKTD